MKGHELLALAECLLLQLLELELRVVPREAPPLPPIAPWSLGSARLLQRTCDFLWGHTISGWGGQRLSRLRLWELWCRGVGFHPRGFEERSEHPKELLRVLLQTRNAFHLADGDEV